MVPRRCCTDYPVPVVVDLTALVFTLFDDVDSPRLPCGTLLLLNLPVGIITAVTFVIVIVATCLYVLTVVPVCYRDC